jgi:hypothetical protein
VCPLLPPMLASGRCSWICPTNDAPKTSNGFDNATARKVDVDNNDDDDDDRHRRCLQRTAAEDDDDDNDEEDDNRG